MAAAVVERFGPAASAICRGTCWRSRGRPDGPLGASDARHAIPPSRAVLVGALADAADPEQATRLLAAFFAASSRRAPTSARSPTTRRVRARLLAARRERVPGRGARGHPDLADRVFFARGVPSAEFARAQVDEEIAALAPDESRDVDAFVGALRRAKRRVTFEVGLADLAGELRTREVAHVLAALADATLDQACRFALRERREIERKAATRSHSSDDSIGLALVAMGKLGGREIGYGSDLDLFFVYEGSSDDAAERAARVAQRVLRLLETPARRGARLRARHAPPPVGQSGAARRLARGLRPLPERARRGLGAAGAAQGARLRGRRELGARVIAVARKAAYERGAPDPERLHHLRTRMERELGTSGSIARPRATT